MRCALAVLIAVSAPASALAGVVEALPSVERLAPAPTFAAPALAPTAGFTPALSAAPLLSAPISAAAFAAPSVAIAAPVSAVPAAPAAAAAIAAASGDLNALGVRLVDENRSPTVGPRSAALDGFFEGACAPAADPAPARETPPAAKPAPLAAPTRASSWRVAVPNLLTFSNMASGLAGAFLASQGHFVPAALAILAGNVFDALDGRAARALGVNNPLGIDLDSLADVVSFGAAPALLIFKAALLPALGWWGFPVAAAFAAAGLYRLARFNVGAHAESSGAAPAKRSDSFTGLPIPGGAGVIVALTLALSSLPAAAVPAVAVATTLLAAAAMVSRLPYPAFKKGGAKGLLAPAAVAATASVPLAALGLSSFIPAAVFGLYLASGPLAALRR